MVAMVELGLAEVWGLVLLVATGFVATSLDNLIILVVLLGAAPQRRGAILLGYISAAIGVMVVAAIGVAVGAWISPALIGYLGLAPLLLGLYLLYQYYRGTAAAELPEQDPTQGSEARNWLSSFLLMFSNSGDSVALFLPLLAESGRESLLWIVSLFLVFALAWAALSLLIAGEPRIARRIEQRGAALVPWIMMAVGLYILLDTGTDTLL
jgi:cadmium resistance protein CadD (predicted permease)